MQIGVESPDVVIEDLQAAWEVTQRLLRKRLISAGHDISDGGIAVALLEMAFAGNLGFQVRLRCCDTKDQCPRLHTSFCRASLEMNELWQQISDLRVCSQGATPEFSIMCCERLPLYACLLDDGQRGRLGV